MRRRLERFLIKIFDSLPRTLHSRVVFIFWLCFPLIMYKIIKGSFFYQQSAVPDEQIYTRQPAIDPIPADAEHREICIRYSGGTDSTLAAAGMAEHFKKVHLLTFNTSYPVFSFGLIQSDPTNAATHIPYLQDRYGADKFVHRILEVGNLRDDIYFNDYQKAAVEKDFNRVNLCPSCVLSMHIHTIIYCLQNGIKYVSDGANIETGVLPWQTQYLRNLLEFQQFYKEFGISYIINPDYHENSDTRLKQLNLIPDPNSKKYAFRKKTQQFCIPIHMQSLCKRLHGNPDNWDAEKGLMSRYFIENMPKYKEYILSRAGNN